MQAMSLSAQAVDVARVALTHEVCDRVSHNINLLPSTGKSFRNRTAHAGRPEKTAAVTDASGTDAVMLGSRAEPRPESVVNAMKAVHWARIFSD